MELPSGSVRPLAWSLHALGLLLVAAPLLDLAAGVGSLNPGQVPWRFGAFGLLSGALVLPLLGFGLMLLAATALDQTLIIRLIGVKTGVLVLIVIGVMVMFGLDALQVRAQIRQEAKRAFDLATIKALLTFGLEVVVLATMAMNSFRSARATSTRQGLRKRDSGTLVVPQGDA